MAIRNYSSTAAETTLQSGINNVSTVILVASTLGFPAAPFTLALDYGAAIEELVDVTAVAGLSLTVTRAVDGTSATTHGAGAKVRHVSSARDFREANDHVNASTNVHGLSGGAAVVGTTTAQTLTNKTLSSPTINSGALSGTFSGNPTMSGTITAASYLTTGGLFVTGPTIGTGLQYVEVRDGANVAQFQATDNSMFLRGDFNWTDVNGWTTYTPSWTSTGTAPAIGNGTITGKFKKIGKTVIARIFVQFGTTTTFGTGTYGFSIPGSLPVASVGADDVYVGAARGHAAAWYHGAACISSTTVPNTVRIFSHNGATEWSPTVPVTWTNAATNYMSMEVVYETSA